MTDKAKHTALIPYESLSVSRTKLNTNFQDAGLATILHATNGGSPYTLAGDYDRVHVDTSSGAVTITLPAAPDEGDTYVIVAVDATNTTTVDRNGNTINGSAADSTITVQWDHLTLVWDDDASTWVEA